MFALRDEIPLPPDGWTVHLHNGLCTRSDGPGGCAPESCNGLHCRFSCFEGEDPAFGLGMRDLSMTLNEMTKGNRGEGADLSDIPLPVTRVTLGVGGAILPGETHDEHYKRSFRLAQDAVKSLRLATQARIPNLTIERVWPQYFMVTEAERGDLRVSVAIVEHGFGGTRPVAAEEVRAANAILTATWQGHPAEVYRDFELGAQNAAKVDGDYPGAVLKAATAVESLIKHTSWMLEWEATTKLDTDPAPTRATLDLFTAKPAQLISGVLSPRLGGNWSSQSDRHPVGAWRAHIARSRNAVIHRGHRPTEYEMGDMLAALDAIESHVLDRLAARADVYPRTALFLAGPEALEARGAGMKADHVANDPAVSPPGLMKSYRTWLDGRLNASAADDT